MKREERIISTQNAGYIAEMTFDEIDLINGGSNVSEALGYASYAVGTAGLAVGVAAAIPGPHSPVLGGVALALGFASASLGAGSYITGYFYTRPAKR